MDDKILEEYKKLQEQLKLAVKSNNTGRATFINGRMRLIESSAKRAATSAGDSRLPGYTDSEKKMADNTRLSSATESISDDDIAKMAAHVHNVHKAGEKLSTSDIGSLGLKYHRQHNGSLPWGNPEYSGGRIHNAYIGIGHRISRALRANHGWVDVMDKGGSSVSSQHLKKPLINKVTNEEADLDEGAKGRLVAGYRLSKSSIAAKKGDSEKSEKHYKSAVDAMGGDEAATKRVHARIAKRKIMKSLGEESDLEEKTIFDVRAQGMSADRAASEKGNPTGSHNDWVINRGHKQDMEMTQHIVNDDTISRAAAHIHNVTKKGGYSTNSVGRLAAAWLKQHNPKMNSANAFPNSSKGHGSLYWHQSLGHRVARALRANHGWVDGSADARYGGREYALIKPEKNRVTNEETLVEDSTAVSSFIAKHPNAQATVHNAIRNFEYAHDAMDHVASMHMHEMSYPEWEKLRPHLVKHFARYGLKESVNESTEQLDERTALSTALKAARGGYSKQIVRIRNEKMRRWAAAKDEADKASDRYTVALSLKKHHPKSPALDTEINASRADYLNLQDKSLENSSKYYNFQKRIKRKAPSGKLYDAALFGDTSSRDNPKHNPRGKNSYIKGGLSRKERTVRYYGAYPGSPVKEGYTDGKWYQDNRDPESAGNKSRSTKERRLVPTGNDAKDHKSMVDFALKHGTRLDSESEKTVRKGPHAKRYNDRFGKK